MSSWIDITGWTLVHFIWQGTLIGIVAAVALRALRHRTPQTRYLVSCTALVVMLVAPLATALVMTSEPALQHRLPPRLVERRSPLHEYLAPAGPGDSGGAPTGSIDQPDIVASAGPGAGAWSPIVVAVWMSGVAVLLLRLAGGWWRIRRVHRTALASPPSRWTAAATRMANILGLTRALHVVDSSLVDTPTVIGWIKPVVLLPIGALAGLTPAQVDAILAHELAHIRRHDFLINLLQTFAETALFYHPAVWWLSARVREEREQCCDQIATSVNGDPIGYAEALIELARWQTSDPGLTIAATGGSLLRRIRRVLGMREPETQRPIGAMAIAIVLTMLLGVVGASRFLLAAQPEVGTITGSVSGDANDPAAWHMVFNHDDMEMRFIGFRGRDLIRFAYQVPEARVLGGPSWMDEQIMSIVVNLDAAPRADEMPDVVRRALEQRLRLQTHVEQRNFPVVALERADPNASLGPYLRVSTTDCFDLQTWIDAGQPLRPLPQTSPRQPVCGEEQGSIGHSQYVAITMQEFAHELRGYVRGWPLSQPNVEPGSAPVAVALKNPDVVDRTGLDGRYDIELRAFAPAAALMTRFPFLKGLFEPLGFSSIPRALEDQLGLRLVESEAPYDVIVIDHVERP